MLLNIHKPSINNYILCFINPASDDTFQDCTEWIQREKKWYTKLHIHITSIYICQIQKPHWRHINQKVIKRQNSRNCWATYMYPEVFLFPIVCGTVGGGRWTVTLFLAPPLPGTGRTSCTLSRSQCTLTWLYKLSGKYSCSPTMGLGECPAHCQGHNARLHDYTNYQASIHKAPPWDWGNVQHIVKVTVCTYMIIQTNRQVFM